MNERQLHLLSYNIRYDSPDDGAFRWSNRRTELVQLLRRHDPDVIGLQEATPGQVRDIFTDLEGAYEWVGKPRDATGNGELTPLFFRSDRLSVAWSSTRWLSETPAQAGSLGWDADVPRTVVVCGFHDQETGRRLRVYNTHFDNVGSQAVMGSIQLLKEWVVNDSTKSSEPYLIMGDLNFTPADTAYSRMGEIARDSLKVAEAEISGPEYTYIGPGFRAENGAGTRYDYVFVSDGIIVERHETLTDSSGGHHPSDHLPVSVSIRIPE